MNKLTMALLTSLSFLVTANVMADTLKLKDGQILKGTLISKDSSMLVFDIGGQQIKINSASVDSISFDDNNLSQNKAVPEKPQAVVEHSVNAIPAGTTLMVKMSSAVDSNKHKAGHRFTARLEADLVVENVVVATRGTTVYGVIAETKQSGRATGSSSLALTFTDIMINNQLVPIQTTGIQAVTESTTKTSVARTARFAAIGGLANGSKGAKNAALAGVGVSLLTGGNSINIPSGTLLEFNLTAAVNV